MLVDGYANGWEIPQGGTFRVRISYQPEALAILAKRVSLIAIVLTLVAMILTALVQRRRRLIVSDWDGERSVPEG